MRCYANNMMATLIQKTRIRLGECRFADVAIWKLPEPVRGSVHLFKYRLALIVDEVCVVRYDNESGKGDRKHVGTQEVNAH